jgi:archaellum component FlaG (FlaF/FlaG flagellin family)
MVDKKKSSNRRTNDGSYFASSRRKNKKYMMIIIPIVAAIIAIAVISAVMYSTQQSGNNNNNYGPVGSAHEHAAFAIKINGKQIDFSQPKYQVQSRLIHVEGGDGTTLHRHATGVPFAEFIKSVNMNIENGCFTLDDGKQYCNNENNKLRFFINGNETESINNYVINPNDRLLVLYGNESADQINQELAALRKAEIKET